MPKAKTGCNVYMNIAVTEEAAKIINKSAKEAGVSRPVYINALFLDSVKRPLLKVEKPSYYPHKPMKRRSIGIR